MTPSSTWWLLSQLQLNSCLVLHLMKIQHVQEVILYLPSLSLHLALLNTLFDFQISNLCKQMIETLSTAILRARLLVWRLSKWENARLEILISIKLPTRRALVKLPLTKLQQVSAQKVEEVEWGWTSSFKLSHTSPPEKLRHSTSLSGRGFHFHHQVVRASAPSLSL